MIRLYIMLNSVFDDKQVDLTLHPDILNKVDLFSQFMFKKYFKSLLFICAILTIMVSIIVIINIYLQNQDILKTDIVSAQNPETLATEVVPATEVIPAQNPETLATEVVPAQDPEILKTDIVSVQDIVSDTKKGFSNLKIFIRDQETLESAINDWLAGEQNISIDQINVNAYEGGSHLVVIGYHTGATGKTGARLKLFAGKDPEADAQAFLSSLNPSQTVRGIAATVGYFSGPETTITSPIIFIIYE